MPHLIASPQIRRLPEGDQCDVSMTAIVNIRASSASSFYSETPSENLYLYRQPLIELRRFSLARLWFRRSNFTVVFHLGERRAERNSEVVQCDQGLRLHSARGRWKQRCIRPYLSGGKGGLQFAGRGREGIVRCCPESRQGIGGKSAAELGRRFTPAGSGCVPIIRPNLPSGRLARAR